MKWEACTLLLLFCQLANAQIDSGTIVAFQMINGKLIMAADSRGVLRGVPSDTQCKISAFRHKVIFAAAGNAASIPTTPGWTAWDATHEARAAVTHTSFAKQKTADGLVNTVADAWGRRMKHLWETDYRQHPDVIKQIAERNHGSLTDGIFAAAMHGTIAIAARTVMLANGSINVVIPVRAEACIPPCATGQVDIFSEYVAGKTQRAAEEKWSASPTDRIIRLVDLTSSHEQPDATGIVSVGGPTDALELWEDGSIHWIQKKSNCPENSN